MKGYLLNITRFTWESKVQQWTIPAESTRNCISTVTIVGSNFYQKKGWNSTRELFMRMWMRFGPVKPVAPHLSQRKGWEGIKLSTDERYNCKHCDKRFSTTNWLKRHIARTHEEPKLKCSFCDRLFTFKWQLEGHENEHKGETPYSCNICGLSYHKRDALRNHVKKKHENGKGSNPKIWNNV